MFYLPKEKVYIFAGEIYQNGFWDLTLLGLCHAINPDVFDTIYFEFQRKEIEDMEIAIIFPDKKKPNIKKRLNELENIINSSAGLKQYADLSLKELIEVFGSSTKRTNSLDFGILNTEKDWFELFFIPELVKLLIEIKNIKSGRFFKFNQIFTKFINIFLIESNKRPISKTVLFKNYLKLITASSKDVKGILTNQFKDIPKLNKAIYNIILNDYAYHSYWYILENNPALKEVSQVVVPDEIITSNFQTIWSGDKNAFVQLIYGLQKAGYIQGNLKALVEYYAPLFGVALKEWQSNLSKSIHNNNNDYKPKIFDELFNAYMNYHQETLKIKK